MQAILTYPEKKQEIQALKAFLKAMRIKFELVSSEELASYSPEFMEKMEKAKKNYEKGEYITIKDTKNIWESILSE